MELRSEYLTVCLEAVYAAGAELQRWVGRFDVREKGRFDLVTQADFASQEVVRRHVLGAFPNHGFIGEEGGADSAEHEYRWIVDPLDGTTNYVHGVPHYAVSLALERRGRLLVGAVFNPASGECFTAVEGQGAFLNDQPIRVSRVESLDQALAAMGLPAGMTSDSPDLKVMLKALFQCQSIRRTGSASLNLCYLAAGRFDVCWSFATKVWDIAAGVLLIREAGGAVSAVDGGPFTLDDPRLLSAANDRLLSRVRQMVVEAGAG